MRSCRDCLSRKPGRIMTSRRIQPASGGDGREWARRGGSHDRGRRTGSGAVMWRAAGVAAGEQGGAAFAVGSAAHTSVRPVGVDVNVLVLGADPGLCVAAVPVPVGDAPVGGRDWSAGDAVAVAGCSGGAGRGVPVGPLPGCGAGQHWAAHPVSRAGFVVFMPDVSADWNVAWRMGVCGIGFGFYQTPANLALMTAGPPSRNGAASGMVAVARTDHRAHQRDGRGDLQARDRPGKNSHHPDDLGLIV